MNTTDTATVSAKTRSARVRSAVKAAKIAEMPGVVKVTVKTERASLMQAVNVKVHMTPVARVEQPDGSWPLTDEARAAIAAVEALPDSQAAAEWATGRHTFFDVSAVTAD